MSLRTKTLLLFLAFVLLPLVLVGVGFSAGTRMAVEEASEVYLEDRARTIAAELDRRITLARSELARVAEDADTRAKIREGLAGGSTGDPSEGLFDLDPRLSVVFDSLELRTTDGSILFSAPSPLRSARTRPGAGLWTGVEESAWCDVGSSLRWLRFESSMESPEDRGSPQGGRPMLVGWVSSASLVGSTASLGVGGRLGETVVIDEGGELVARAGDCRQAVTAVGWVVESAREYAARAPGPDVDIDEARFRNGGRLGPERWEASAGDRPVGGSAAIAHASVPASGWTVSSTTSLSDVGASIDRLELAYAGFVLLIGVLATAAFTLVLGRLFGSFRELRTAVEEIGRGDFAPWLPPPGRDEIGWLSLSLGRMAERINHMMQSVEQFGRLAVIGEMAAHVAHEIRTPLSSIKLNLQKLKRDVESGIIPERSRDSIELGIREVVRLEGTVGNILQLGGGDREIARRPCSLHTLISESVDVIQDRAEEKDVSLTMELAAESDWIRADPGRIKGAFLNLLMNALDASPPGGSVSIDTQLFLGEEGKQMVAAAVTDEGPGVPPGIRTEIFNPFFTTKENGNGLGLSAALRSAREHGGGLFLTERPDGGTGACFVVVLPLFPGQGPVPERAEASRRPLTWNGADVGPLRRPSKRRPPWRPSSKREVEED